MKVHLNDGSPPPSDANYFVVAGNGTFVHKQTGWVEATVPVKNIDGLLPQTTEVRLLLPRMASTVFAKAVLFLHTVYKKKGIESAVLLHYSAKQGWDITVPKQEATSAHVDYILSERLPGYQCVGTMHSHCTMSAFHSGTDIGDEASHDGIHITIGLLDHFPKFGMDGEFVVNGNRFPLAYEHIVRVRQEDETPAKAGQVSPQYLSMPQHNTLYTIPFGILRDWIVPDEWVRRVKKKRWAVFTGAFEPLGGHGYVDVFPPHRRHSASSLALDFKEDIR
ncbi:MAG: hypothetical protein A3J08_04370 [Candidatus Lloydbacteria bacterium RIFCSPLOWO2_02_FULL_51_11]|uniref:Uncharacterized protein n=1 Tax=Candidatus Lloydbacteria bacterium RIFCSPLOWO2_02_FULL_51_11 TaxID=1798667 RepID=A0A1G2DPF8_9BACT|nr:MAG: hypothetical protein A3J08_04370 [Candidatus Lloydbacteria bacterium RIFCSPLOWO2_02_FULL_51_11]